MVFFFFIEFFLVPRLLQQHHRRYRFRGRRIARSGTWPRRNLLLPSNPLIFPSSNVNASCILMATILAR